MIGRRTIIGLSLLCALFVGAFAAQGAFAAKDITAYTCAPSSTGSFKDEHCTTEQSPTSAGFVHAVINGTTKEIEITNAKTKNETKEATPSVLNVPNLLGVAVEISCSTISGNNGELTNVVGPPMRVTGKGTIKFSGCTVAKPKNCKVAEPIEAAVNAESTIISEAPEEMGLKLTPQEEQFTKITFQNKSETEKCSEVLVKNSPFPVKGSVIATANGEPNGKGATAVVTPAMSSLTVGAGAAATLSATATFRMTGGNPLVFTTK